MRLVRRWRVPPRQRPPPCPTSRHDRAMRIAVSVRCGRVRAISRATVPVHARGLVGSAPKTRARVFWQYAKQSRRCLRRAGWGAKGSFDRCQWSRVAANPILLWPYPAAALPPGRTSPGTPLASSARASGCDNAGLPRHGKGSGPQRRWSCPCRHAVIHEFSQFSFRLRALPAGPAGCRCVWGISSTGASNRSCPQ